MSIVFVFVMTTDTLRASVTRNAGPVKSMTPLMKAFAVACSPSRPTIPTTIAMTKNSGITKLNAENDTRNVPANAVSIHNRATVRSGSRTPTYAQQRHLESTAGPTTKVPLYRHSWGSLAKDI